MFTRDELKTFFCCSLSVLLPFHFFSPAFLCRCGDQPTSAFFFFLRQWNLKLKQNIQVLSSSSTMVRKEWMKRGRDREMTISLFPFTVISLEDK